MPSCSAFVATFPPVRAGCAGCLPSLLLLPSSKRYSSWTVCWDVQNADTLLPFCERAGAGRRTAGGRADDLVRLAAGERHTWRVLWLGVAASDAGICSATPDAKTWHCYACLAGCSWRRVRHFRQRSAPGLTWDERAVYLFPLFRCERTVPCVRAPRHALLPSLYITTPTFTDDGDVCASSVATAAGGVTRVANAASHVVSPSLSCCGSTPAAATRALAAGALPHNTMRWRR